MEINDKYRDDNLRMLRSLDRFCYFHAPSIYPDTPLLYREIINQATQSIDIMDPYFHVQDGNPDYEDAEIFMDIQNNLEIRIITEVKDNCVDFYRRNAEITIRRYITADKNCRLGMKMIRTNINPVSRFHFHDRFLIIDNSRIYIVGGSIENHRICHNSTGIYELTSPPSQEFIKDIFAYYWANATDEVIPMKYLTD